MLVRKFLPQEPQSPADALDNLFLFPVSTRFADAKPGKPKARGRDAGDGVLVVAIQQSAIFYLSG